MCGFAGWLRWDGAPLPVEERRALLHRMGAQLARRGPDDEGIYDDGVLSFVFRRLAVNDPAGGRQPLYDETGTIVAAVNGEIYNHAALRAGLAGRHAFAGRSDCEVVVHLYEETRDAAFLERLRGMYALLVWDREHRRGLIARDRLGIKPLYYARLRDGLLFASELTALLAHPDCPREVEHADLDHGYIGGEKYTAVNYDRVPTFVRGVSMLGGGETLSLGATGAGAPRRYWSLLPAIARSRETAPRAPETYVREYADLLDESIRLHLEADAPVGVFLSGGLDSSLVAAAAARTARPHCFSVCEATTIATGDMARAAGLTRTLGLPFHPVRYDRATFADELDFSLASLEELVWTMDAPRFAPELFFKFELHRYAKTVQPGLKVILVGQGADEFAGGYSTSFSSPRRAWRDYVADSLEPRVRAAAAAGERAHAPFHCEMLARLTALQSHNLWNEDRVAAAFGVETRVPYLDHRLVEFLAAIPPVLHPELFWNKRIVRDAARRWLPPDLTGAPKVLFWQADDTSSVHAIMAACARRVYPAFRESYLGRDSATTGRFDALHRRVARGGPATRGPVQRLLADMTFMIFERMCGTLHALEVPVPPAEPSRLRPDADWSPEGTALMSGRDAARARSTGGRR
ncbi:asparagine synthase (glutamine-hydrolyzing) [Actinomadura sp. KC216]|uniref:asparagine synthase (glutamine-hydrolyzing) n=1 Tax=Actinomadura sp. KC216 TaxID=2530370 RepID=UPI001048E136|nr:asparagine synthase (glutamine-hydrolyzing) [Actinomadura sp. KC216]TDB79432.1 asparagine synthase (glutamine-hydrolyzing) [Actinomadura sp. KC216]